MPEITPEESRIAQIAQACEGETGEVPPVSTTPGWSPRRGMLSSLRHPRFRLFWTGNFLSNIGNWMQNLAQGWLVLQLTNSVFLLGLVGFASSLPTLVFSLVGGVIADRADRRRMMMITQGSMMMLAFLLSFLTWRSWINVQEVILISFLAGVANAMNAPAYQSIVPELVPREDLTNAIAMNSAQFNMSRMVGPMIPGLALKFIGSAGCFFLNALSFLALLYALMRLRFGAPPGTPSTGFWKPLREGFRYIRGRPDLATLMVLVALVSLCALPYISLAPYFARDILHMGPEGLGYLMGAAGLGALTGAFLLARFGDGPRKGARVLRGVCMVFAALIVFALSRNALLAMAAAYVTGVAMVTAVGSVNNLLQKHVDPAMRGRVMSMHATAFLGFAPIGSLLAGAMGAKIGAPAAIATLCASGLGATLLVAWQGPKIRELA
jgi:MFS family permease